MSILFLPRRVCALGCAFLSLLAGGSRAAEPPAGLVLTDDDKAWLAAHRVIRVGYDPDYRPFCFRDAQGNLTGIDAGMLAAVAAPLGVRFEFVTGRDWTEVYGRAGRGEVDMLTSTAITPEREQRFLFTREYVTFPVTIVTQSDGPFAVTVTDLKTMRVAAVSDYAPTVVLKRGYPELQLLPAGSMDEALLLVSRGEADAAVTNLANASYIIKTRGLTNLKIAGVIPQTFGMRFAVRRDWPQWHALLEKTLAALPPQETARILDPWIRVDYAAVIRWDVVRRWAIIGAAFAAVVIGLVSWRNAGLRREPAKRRAVQAALETTHARLNAANVELTAQHEEKTHLLRVAAHDLRNPLTGIMLSVGVLRAEVDSAAARPLLEQLESTARQMTRLIDDLLDVNELETGCRRLVIEPADVPAAVRETLDGHQGSAAHKRIALAASTAGPVPAAAVDARGLRQVLDNLLSNALKFSPHGKRVEVAVSAWQEFVRIEISDQGPGVPDAEKERIFAKFTRGTARPTDGEKSTGLGLAIVRELVAAMNGRVWCQPAAGGGAVFVVVLPQHRAATAV